MAKLIDRIKVRIGIKGLGKADLSGANLSEANLSGADLREANLSGAFPIRADLSKADLRGADLSKADLSRADLIEADLIGADLSKTKLSGANLSGANLRGANLSGANLSGANLSGANLSEANLSGANLSGANLSGANFSGANLSGANLSGANLSGANLSGAVLKATQALGTNFESATLDGACIEDWHINNQTKLDNISCDHIYLKLDNNPVERIFLNRLPHDINRKFGLGEFTKLFQQALDTVALIFSNGFDLEAFNKSIKQIQLEDKNAKFDIESIEKKGDVLVVKVSSSDADKGKIEREFWQGYNQINEKNEIILRQLNNQDQQITQKNMPFINIINNLNNSNPQPSLREQFEVVTVVTEILNLLKNLESTNPPTTKKETIVAQAAEEIKKNPTLKARVMGAVKSGAVESFKETVNNPLVKILVAIVDGWNDVE